MLKALIFSLFIATTSLTSTAFAATTNTHNQQQAEYTELVQTIGKARYVIAEMAVNISLRSDRELAIKLFKHANNLYKSLGPVPTVFEVAKINTIVANFEKIEILYKTHFGKRYVEI